MADGSTGPVLAAHARVFGAVARHLAVVDARSRNGKVDGVRTGVLAASHEAIVLADDDVRYEPDQLRAMEAMLATADLVVPQNIFTSPMPWHARWDTARTLLDRSWGMDYPGTLGVRRSRFVAMGGYDGDVLFENLELIRTVRAHGGRVRSVPSLLVRRHPPSLATFLAQRPRQAYDDLAQPWRLALWLAVAPTSAIAMRRGRWEVPAAVALAAVMLARRGRGAERAFPASAVAFAPPWVAERAVLLVVRRGLAADPRRLPVPRPDDPPGRHAQPRPPPADAAASVAGGRRARRVIGGLHGPRSDHVVRAVAERLGARTAAAAQRHDRAPHGDRDPVLIDELHGPADQVRAVAVGGDRRLGSHAPAVTPGGAGANQDHIRRLATPPGRVAPLHGQQRGTQRATDRHRRLPGGRDRDRQGAIAGAIIGAVVWQRLGAILASALFGAIGIGMLGAFMGGMASLESPDPGQEPSEREHPLEEPELTSEERPLRQVDEPGSAPR